MGFRREKSDLLSIGYWAFALVSFLFILAAPQAAFSANMLIGIDFGAAATTTPTNWTLITTSGSTGYLINESGAMSVASIYNSGGSTWVSTPVASTIPTHTPSLDNIGGHLYSFWESVTVTISGLKSGLSYNVWVCGIRQGVAYTQDVSIVGADGTTSFTQAASSDYLTVNSAVGSSSSTFASYAISKTADSSGQISATITSTAGYWGIAAIAVEGDIDLMATPTVTTAAVTDVTATSASSGGNVTSEGGGSVTARGVCWSTSANPTIADSTTTDGTGSGSFTSSITGLSVNTTYHVRAYATNVAGTGYGSEETFVATTSTSVPTLREWGMILFALLLACSSMFIMRRFKTRG